MVDPSTVLSIALSCAKALKALYDRIHRMKSVDGVLKDLKNEIKTFSTILDAICATRVATNRTQPSSTTTLERIHWEHVGTVLTDCKITLTSLEKLLRGVRLKDGRIWNKALTWINLDEITTQINEHQQRLTEFRGAMQIFLQLITMYPSTQRYR